MLALFACFKVPLPEKSIRTVTGISVPKRFILVASVPERAVLMLCATLRGVKPVLIDLFLSMVNRNSEVVSFVVAATSDVPGIVASNCDAS